MQHTYKDLLFVELCRDPSPVYCITDFGKKHTPLISPIVQSKLTAGLGHCKTLVKVCLTPTEYMQALIDGLSATTERFASPLNFNPLFESYYSIYLEDKLFGAAHDAYSCKWQGSSQVRPASTTKDMEKPVRWAIFSAKETTEPVLTSIVLPSSAGTSYLRWLPHPMVQEIATINMGHFQFQDPLHWCSSKDFSSHAKWDMQFLLMAYTAGSQHFVKQDWLQRAFADATTNLKHAHQMQHTTQIRNYVDTASHLQGLYPPPGFSTAENGPCPKWSVAPVPTASDLQHALDQNVVVKTTLLHNPEHIIYTNGSKKDLPGFGPDTGSGVYRRASSDT